MDKPRIVLCNKIDIEGALERAEEVRRKIRESEPNIPVITVSVAARTNITPVRKAIVEMVEKMEDGRKSIAENAKEMKKNSFLAGRSVDTDMEEQFPGSEA